MRVSRSVAMACVWAGLFALPVSTFAQAGLQLPLEFDFLNPGARSLALGSAFVGLADDATAALTNPAGLTALLKPEFSIEGRGRSTQSRFLERGRLSGTSTNQGIDTIQGPVYGVSSDSGFSPGFISFVYPHENRLAIAAYYRELTSFSDDFEMQGVFFALPGLNQVFRETALQASRDLVVDEFGASFAYRPTATVSIGAGVSVGKLSMDSTFTRFVTVPITAEATYEPARAVFEGTQTADDVGVGASVGVLWAPRRLFQVGAVFRKGASYEFTQTLRDLPDGAPTADSGRFKVPDTFAVGAAIRPKEDTTITLEYTYVQYGELKHDYIDVQAEPSRLEDQFTISDASEFHAGFEYVLSRVPLTPALRVGYWYDPAHAVEFTPIDLTSPAEQRFAAYLPGEDGLSHFTFGGGLPITNRFELNVAADLSKKRDFYSVFAVVRF